MRRQEIARILRGMKLPRLFLLSLGWLLVLLAPLVGLLPGPGGIFVFAGGLALLLRNSAWVRRRYARFMRRWPRLGRLSDRALRRTRAPRNRIAPATAD